MKVAMINAGPIEKFTTTYRALSLARNLVNQFDVDVHLIVTYNKADYETYGKLYKGVKIWYVPDFTLRLRRWNPLFPLRYTSSSTRRYKILNEIKPDAVHAFKPLPINVFPVLWYTRKNCPSILDIDDAEFEMRKAGHTVSYPELYVTKYLEDRTPYWCDYLTTASKFFYDRYRQEIGRVEYIPNGVDLKEFKDVNVKEIKMNYNLGDRNLLYVGTMIKCFDTDWTIRSFAEISKKYNDVQLVLVGDGPQKRELENLAKNLGVEKSVNFIGHISHEEVPLLLSAVDILLLPLKNNYINQCRCPVKLREYMASGTPIVAHAVGEAKVALANCGKLCDPDSMEAFTRSILSLLDNYKNGKKMAEEARKKSEECTWEKLSKKLFQVYESVVVRVPT